MGSGRESTTNIFDMIQNYLLVSPLTNLFFNIYLQFNPDVNLIVLITYVYIYAISFYNTLNANPDNPVPSCLWYLTRSIYLCYRISGTSFQGM